MSNEENKNIIAGRFELLERIGKGSFGEVLKAKDLQLDRIVAIKLFFPDKSVLETVSKKVLESNFINEAKFVASLDHPYVVPIYDFGQIDNGFFIVMKHIDGTHLGHPELKLDLKQTTEIFYKVAQAIEYIHTRKPAILHRDIKPQNILIDKEGHPYLIDFGLGRYHDLEKTSVCWNDQFKGSARYAAPELIQGFVGHQLYDTGEQEHLEEAERHRMLVPNPKLDLWSLGATFYKLYTDEAPLKGGIQEMFHHIWEKFEINLPSSINSQIPTEIDNILMNLLSYDPDFRTESASEVVDELAKLLPGSHNECSKLEIEIPEQMSQAIDSPEYLSQKLSVIEQLVGEKQPQETISPTPIWKQPQYIALGVFGFMALFFLVRSPSSLENNGLELNSELQINEDNLQISSPTLNPEQKKPLEINLEDLEREKLQDQNKIAEVKVPQDAPVRKKYKKSKPQTSDKKVVWSRTSQPKVAANKLKAGQQIPDVVLTHKIVSYDRKSPVTAQLRKDFYLEGNKLLPEGTEFVGNAGVSRNSNRIEISFDKYRVPNGDYISFKGIGLMPDGSRGIIASVDQQLDKKLTGRAGKSILRGAGQALSALTPVNVVQEFGTGVAEDVLDTGDDAVGEYSRPDRVLSIGKYMPLAIHIEKAPK